MNVNRKLHKTRLIQSFSLVSILKQPISSSVFPYSVHSQLLKAEALVCCHHWVQEVWLAARHLPQAEAIWSNSFREQCNQKSTDRETSIATYIKQCSSPCCQTHIMPTVWTVRSQEQEKSRSHLFSRCS